MEERKRDTRRKILAGAYVMKMFEGDLQKLGRELTAAGMLEPRDYSIFGVNDNTNNTDADRLALV